MDRKIARNQALTAEAMRWFVVDSMAKDYSEADIRSLISNVVAGCALVIESQAQTRAEDTARLIHEAVMAAIKDGWANMRTDG